MNCVVCGKKLQPGGSCRCNPRQPRPQRKSRAELFCEALEDGMKWLSNDEILDGDNVSREE